MYPVYNVIVFCHDGTWLAKPQFGPLVDGSAVIQLVGVPSFAALEQGMREVVAALTDSEPDAFALNWLFGED